MGDHSSMSFSADNPLDKTLNLGPLLQLLRRQYKLPFGINTVQFSNFFSPNKNRRFNVTLRLADTCGGRCPPHDLGAREGPRSLDTPLAFPSGLSWACIVAVEPEQTNKKVCLLELQRNEDFTFVRITKNYNKNFRGPEENETKYEEFLCR